MPPPPGSLSWFLLAEISLRLQTSPHQTSAASWCPSYVTQGHRGRVPSVTLMSVAPRATLDTGREARGLREPWGARREAFPAAQCGQGHWVRCTPAGWAGECAAATRRGALVEGVPGPLCPCAPAPQDGRPLGWERSGPTQQSCSSSAKLLVIAHMLQAASRLGDFVPVSPLPGSHSLPPALG